MGEDICGWELFLKALCRFIRVGRKCSYIDECIHPRVRARRSDDRAAVRVPNQDYGTADPLQSPSHVGDILGVRIESVLRCDHLMSLGQKGRDEFAEARAVCPEAVDEDDAGFALICHNLLLSFNWDRSTTSGHTSLHIPCQRARKCSAQRARAPPENG